MPNGSKNIFVAKFLNLFDTDYSEIKSSRNKSVQFANNPESQKVERPGPKFLITADQWDETKIHTKVNFRNNTEPYYSFFVVLVHFKENHPNLEVYLLF